MSTTIKHPLISVCIPAYNRAAVLPELLDSIVAQDFDDYEIVISEDCSPERESIRAIIDVYSTADPGRIRYHENLQNLGYDGNLRCLVNLAAGEFCLFMGNDDLMCPHALIIVAKALRRHPSVGVVLRSYATFNAKPENIIEVARYFSQELFFPCGARTIATIYRRAVVISGLVVHRQGALRLATERFDGTLLYQLYLIANLLIDMNAVYVPEVTILYRTGGIPDFGNSAAERAKFTPKEQTANSCVHFMRGMLEIAKDTQERTHLSVYRAVVGDIANYSYPILAIQAERPLNVFVRYSWSLARLGFWRYPMFYAWFLGLLLLGPKCLGGLIRRVKERLGYTPALGRLYRGEAEPANSVRRTASGIARVHNSDKGQNS